jgi:hypothetical protein
LNPRSDDCSQEPREDSVKHLASQTAEIEPYFCLA